MTGHEEELKIVVLLVLNVYKPQGMTRYGWRKQEQRCQQHEQAPVLVP